MTRSRLTWLDALRGYAAAVVALFHLSPTVLGQQRHLALFAQFDAGRYGVLLFFLISGYVIPMSLERHGSLRRFWISRIFRIYPAYLLTIVVGLALAGAGWLRLHPTLYAETTTSVLGHATMLQELLGLRGVVRPFWTLAYEMTFYLIVAGLFAWRRHRDSAWWAAGLALIVLVLGRRLPGDLLAGSPGDRRIAAVVLALLLAGTLAAYVGGRRVPVLIVGAAGIGTVLLPLLDGQPTRYATAGDSSGAALLLAVMFAGTLVHRAQHRQLDRRVAGAVLALVLVAAGINQWLLDQTGLLRNSAVAAAVAGTFAIAFGLRHRAVPGLLTRLGAISFSIYLLHIPVLVVVSRVLRGHPFAIGAAFVAGTLAVAGIAFHLVERPGQRLGRRVWRRCDARFGPDVRVTGAATEGGMASTGSFGKQRESV
ncbi:acyltransferase family protein [Actinoplanes teichomyceticus]|uniref:Peptidoglycan/LPS O-acetylase OafA/YrhL n=1 Tax=Actinoplanes teichomyceticus TaxID=1867 RepID=A0A561W9K7_ACTTI|nr:acyltransferase [Actinoplanes teichomyceticus]TWG20555.1 peptidoglycan/LPS O-acetylase OafA/YrhL [Actinoplanes teichomyceticus]GIF15890.1 hypothetical protein Ate01nite_59220 [Actinoplanes teichomyceticus]